MRLLHLCCPKRRLHIRQLLVDQMHRLQTMLGQRQMLAARATANVLAARKHAVLAVATHLARLADHVVSHVARKINLDAVLTRPAS